MRLIHVGPRAHSHLPEALFGAVCASGPVWKTLQTIIQLIKVENELIIQKSSRNERQREEQELRAECAPASFNLQKEKTHETTAHCTAENNTALSHVKCCWEYSLFHLRDACVCVCERDREGAIVMERPFSGFLWHHTQTLKKYLLPFRVLVIMHYQLNRKWILLKRGGGGVRFIGNCLYNKNSNVVKLLQFKITVFYVIIFWNVIYSCDQSWVFSIITSVFSVTWSFRNHSNMLVLKHFLLLLLMPKSCAALWKFFQYRKFKRTASIITI